MAHGTRPHTIRLETTTIVGDARHTLGDMADACPGFFAYHIGHHERFIVHRGHLVVRSTKMFLDGPRRLTTVYLFTRDREGSPALFCVSAGFDLPSVAAGKRLINQIVDCGWYTYAMRPPAPTPTPETPDVSGPPVS